MTHPLSHEFNTFIKSIFILPVIKCQSGNPRNYGNTRTNKSRSNKIYFPIILWTVHTFT